MKITGHKTSSMFKRYADLFSDEEKRAQQCAVQSKRRALVAGACNHPNCLVLPFSFNLIRSAA
jgi:hypothetical protein